MEEFIRFLKDNTTKDQYNAITYTRGPLLVAAGAGSGKTRVITFKIAYLIKRGVSPDRILAVTFTNKAANEMKERVKHLTGFAPYWIRTFHSACVRILRKYGNAIDIKPDFKIATETDQKNIIKEVMKEQKAKERKKLSLLITNLKNNYSSYLMNKDRNGRSLQRICKQLAIQLKLKPPVDKAYYYYRDYEKIKQKYEYLDFDDLLLKTMELLQSSPEIRKKLQNYFEYILVDEYQDTNNLQERIIGFLMQNGNITVVGDDYQSIYRFRGAVIQNFLNFEKKYNAKKIVLGCNFRSIKTIVEASSELIKNNLAQVHKELYASDKTDIPIYIKSFADEYDEAKYIPDIILKLVKQKGCSYKDIAVLYRSAYISYILQHELIRQGIPVMVVGDTFFFKKREIKIIILFLRMVFQNDKLALLQFLEENFLKGFGEKGLEKLKKYAETLDTVLDIVNQAGYGREFTRQQRMTLLAVKDGVEMVKRYNKSADAVQAFLDTFQNVFRDYLTAISEDKEQLEERKRSVDEFLSFSKSHQDINELLEEIALLTDKVANVNEKNAVNLTTVHQAKGLEWKAVIILGAEEGIFPTRHAVTSAEIEEERRLFYVAITRAKRYLLITYTFYRNNCESRLRISRFVKEIPGKYVTSM